MRVKATPALPKGSDDDDDASTVASIDSLPPAVPDPLRGSTGWGKGWYLTLAGLVLIGLVLGLSIGLAADRNSKGISKTSITTAAASGSDGFHGPSIIIEDATVAAEEGGEELQEADKVEETSEKVVITSATDSPTSSPTKNCESDCCTAWNARIRVQGCRLSVQT